jgi:dihydropteroate synthase
MGVVNVTPDSFSDGGQWYGADEAIGHGLDLAGQGAPRLVAAAGVGYVVVHWRGHSRDMYSRAEYGDVVAEVRDELSRRVDAVMHAGMDPGRIVVDPGLGFGKRPEHNWPLLAHLAQLGTLAGGTFPVLIGASRKRFLGNLLAGPDGTPRPFAESDGATVAVTALAAAAGAWCVRVHQVPLNADAVRVASAWRRAAAPFPASPAPAPPAAGDRAAP